MLTSMLLYMFIAIILDIYAFRGVKMLSVRIKNNNYRKKVIYSYWLIDIFFVLLSMIWIIIIRTANWPDYVKYSNYLYISGGFALIYFPRFIFAFFVLINDIKLFFIYLFRRMVNHANIIYRIINIPNQNRFILSIGVLASMIVFLMVVQGIIAGKSDFVVNELEIHFKDLPKTFDGFEIVHISDTHLGSFNNPGNVIKGIDMISDIDPGIILFTGDLVNNDAAEGLPYVQYFQELQPEYGKFSVLGNHDIGDYRRWYMIEEKEPCIGSIKALHENMGFQLLRNRHVFIQSGKDSIMIAGVDNWGLPPFKQAGDLNAALASKTDSHHFVILLSHDPTHWSEEVLTKTNIQLTLSGHTHGMQIGFEAGNYRWSPASYLYRHWYGLYEKYGQYLYVNRGFGFLGLPLRVGMRPEITVIRIMTNNQ